MPVVDKLPALLRDDLEYAFEDDLDNVFDLTNTFLYNYYTYTGS